MFETSDNTLPSEREQEEKEEDEEEQEEEEEEEEEQEEQEEQEEEEEEEEAPPQKAVRSAAAAASAAWPAGPLAARRGRPPQARPERAQPGSPVCFAPWSPVGSPACVRQQRGQSKSPGATCRKSACDTRKPLGAA